MLRFLFMYPATIILGMVALMSGILSIIREVWLIYRPETRPRSLFSTCMWIALVISSLLLSYSQYQRAESLEKQLAEERDKSKPKAGGPGLMTEQVRGTPSHYSTITCRSGILLPCVARKK